MGCCWAISTYISCLAKTNVWKCYCCCAISTYRSGVAITKTWKCYCCAITKTWKCCCAISNIQMEVLLLLCNIQLPCRRSYSKVSSTLLWLIAPIMDRYWIHILNPPSLYCLQLVVPLSKPNQTGSSLNGCQASSYLPLLPLLRLSWTITWKTPTNSKPKVIQPFLFSFDWLHPPQIVNI